MDLGLQKGNLNQLKEDVYANPLCILKKAFACFLPVKVLQIFLSVCENCVHMSLVLNSKFKGPVAKQIKESKHRIKLSIC